MNNLQVLGKFLDQPLLVAKFQSSVPKVLAGVTAGYTAMNVINAPNGKKKETVIRTGVTLASASLGAIAAPFIASKITKRAVLESVNTVKKTNKELVDTFISNNSVTENTKNMLNKAKNNILSFYETKTIFKSLSNDNNGKKLLEKLIPSPKNTSAKDIFSEIGYLSIYGAVPVAGGITGGIAADKINEKNKWKEKIPDKIKEGAYQYLANIFLCNVGAGAALGILEQSGIRSKAARAIGMTAGIIITGIIGGSKIANLIGRKVVDPVCNKMSKKPENKQQFQDMMTIEVLNDKKYKSPSKDRTPELLDIGLHTDDIATVSLLSGLKWIEPALPLMYTVSGYRAGIGYRN